MPLPSPALPDPLARLPEALAPPSVPARRAAFLRSSGAVLVNLLAAALVVLLEPDGQVGPMVLFMAVVMISSWYGGRLAGLFAAAVATWTTGYLVLSPGNFAVRLPDDFLRLAAFAAVSLLVSGVNSTRASLREIDRQRRWVQSLLDLEVTPLLLVDPRSQEVAFANRAARETARGEYPLWSRDDSAGRFSTPEGELGREDMPAARAARGERVEGALLSWRLPDGPRALLVNARLVPAMLEQPEMVMLSFQDITPLEQATEALERSEARHRALAEGAPVGIFQTDGAGAWQYANPQWHAITGISREAAEANDWLNAIHEEDRSPVWETWTASLWGGTELALECRFRQADGGVIWANVRAVPLRDKSGALLGFIGTVADITEQKRTRDALRLLADASAVLGAAHNTDDALYEVARMAALRKGDWCAIHLLFPNRPPPADGAIAYRAVVAAHCDPSREEALQELLCPLEPGKESPSTSEIAEVIRSGRPRVFSGALPGADPSSAAPDEIRERVCLCVPLIASGRVVGALTLAGACDRAPCSREERILVEDLAARIAAAVENALLYREARLVERQLRHQLDFTSAITRSLDEGVCVIDPGGRVIFINPAAARLLGWREEDLLGTPLGMALRLLSVEGVPLPTSQEGLFRLVRRQRQARRGEYLVQRADGGSFPAAITSSPVRTEGAPVGTVVAFSDITQRKEEEAALRRLSEQRAQLVATVSHSLRAPITAMMLNLEILADGTLGPLTEIQKEYVSRAIDSSVELAETVDDLLTLSRFQDRRVRLEIQECDIGSLVTDMLRRMEPRAQMRRISLGLEVSPSVPPVPTDVRQLGAVLTELLENAIKYTPCGGRVRVLVEARPHDVRVRVVDSGPGITEEDLPHLFEPFYRGAAATEEQVKGTGLGLKIVQEIAALLGAQLRVENAAGGGAAFEVLFPRRDAGPPSAATPNGIGGGEVKSQGGRSVAPEGVPPL